MKKFILLICAILTLIVISNDIKKDYYVIPNESIRIRIVPNSNKIEDQLIKKQIKNNLELKIEKDLNNSKTIEQSRKIIKNNINNYKKEIDKVIKQTNKKINYNIDYGNHYFPEKKYKGLKYKAGMYESLLITIGKADGNNWWCVLFPPICSLEVDDSNTSNVKYTTYIKEIYEKYIK